MTLQSFWQNYHERASLPVVQLAYGYMLRGSDVDVAFEQAQNVFSDRDDGMLQRTQVVVNHLDKAIVYEIAALTQKGLQYLKAQVEKRGGLDVTNSFGQYHLELLMWKHHESFYVVRVDSC